MSRLSHITTVHQRHDTRIRVKECAWLSVALKEPVCLYVQDGMGDWRSQSEVLPGQVEIRDVGAKLDSRLKRVFVGAWRMYRGLRRVSPAVVHFHDPELIPVGLALKLSGIKVIYDVHEDLPRQILGKHWIPVWLRRPVSWAAEVTEWVASRVFDGIVAATPTIARRFPDKKTVTVQNFPILDELIRGDSIPYAKRPPNVAYVGGITAIRGAREMLESLCRVQDERVRLQLAGEFSPKALEDEARNHEAWARVDFHGWAVRAQVAKLLGSVRVGLVVLHPTCNYLDALPVKMFEYMAAGLPVIASDFPLWREIVEGAGCGLLVDPVDPQAIAEAIDWLLGHPKEAEAMGQRGREAVESTYNWERESRTLVDFYKQLLAK